MVVVVVAAAAAVFLGGTDGRHADHSPRYMYMQVACVLGRCSITSEDNTPRCVTEDGVQQNH